MSRVSFDNYGALARSGLTATEKAGRYIIQQDAEKLILADVVAKLEIGPEDEVLDIGCGAGLLLIPLAFLAHRVTGIDHPAVIADLGRRFSHPAVTLIGGAFPDVVVEGRFSAAIAYGVINYMATAAELSAFIDRALDLLAPGGRLLIGDVPNQDKKHRFLATPTGRAFDDEWRRRMAAAPEPEVPAGVRDDRKVLTYDDGVVLDQVARLRARGLDAFVLPQPPALPFGHTREDILVRRPPA